MIEKIELDRLCQDSVSLKKQNYVEVEGQEQPVGQPWRKAYINSVIGRLQAEVEIPEPQKTAVFAVWGEEPTVFPETI